MTSKYVGIWFPISTFVMIGFEHIPANFYLCEIGLLANGSDVTFADVLLKNWIPVTLGNFVAGAFIVAAGYSYVYGRVGQLLVEMKRKQTTTSADIEFSKVVVPESQAAQRVSFDRCVSEGSIHGM
eukprot:TRINITY_DN13821_c0_g3_i1.p2 TRINITY_DN13821_c0_g3~~TRINITY_DN13821_c0_g3_i1.p2  ORF type:complete len:126 (+),score=18.86 TRINITY_DN13821_c0_g3_i1:2-379(+)